VLTGVFAGGAISATADSPGGSPGLLEGNAGQVLTQLYGIAVVVIYDAVVSFIILKVLDAIMGLRVGDEAERDGLDLALHGETIQ
jgi:Amt family ammonium transporter